MSFLAKWESTVAPAVAVETTEHQTLAIYWGATIPAIPDRISIEQARSGMSYETAFDRLLQEQQRWIQQLHGDSRFILSLRLITTGNSQQDLVFGLVGKTEGNDETETIAAARNFYNKIRDTFPNGYPLEPCRNLEQLALLRLPFLPNRTGTLAEFRRRLTPLTTIASTERPDRTGVQINPWQPQNSHFQDLFRALVNHPIPAAVAVNLRPTQLTPDELNYIANQARLYANIASISRTESSQNRILSSSTQYQEKLVEAETASQAWTQLQTAWRAPFEMTVSILADSDLPQSILAALQTAIDGETTSASAPKGGGEIAIARSEAQKIALRQNWADLTLHRWGNTADLARLPWLFSPEEVRSLFRLPIRDRAGTWGLPSAPGANDARRPEQQRDRVDLRIGALHLNLKQLTQHLLICGVPGSGKTNTSLHLLETLWREHRTPWMVLEPAKTEYRGLKTVRSLQEDLLIFSLGDERTAPFRFNPFEVPPGINLDSHQGALLDLFSVAMSMWGPLPNVVEQLIQEAYKRKGFTVLGDNSQLVPPRFSDLTALIPELVPNLGYKKETTDEITAALSVRLKKFCRGALGRMLNATESIPFDALMQRPVILEMSQMTNTDDRAFVMGLILNRCYQYWTARRSQATGELKHLLLVEEAHNLLANASESGDREQANPKAKAVRNFANMLAEVRGFGQGIAIAEQNPEGLIPDVMVNTNLKLAHRVVEAKNRETLGRSMLLTPQQEQALAALKVGQFLYYLGGQPEPSITVAPNFKDDAANGFNPRLSDAEIQTFFRTFHAQHAALYAPPFGCPADAQLATCIEQGESLVEILSGNPRYNPLKPGLILQLLAAPFGLPAVQNARPIFGKILSERGANHLNAQQIEGILNSAISLLALEAVQEKGKVHGWLGRQMQHAHRLLVEAIFNPTPQLQQAWLQLCQIPPHLLDMGIYPAEYASVEAPGAFQYEASIFLTRKTEFTQYLAKVTVPPSTALKDWFSANSSIFYRQLSPGLVKTLNLEIALQLTESNPGLLSQFIENQ